MKWKDRYYKENVSEDKDKKCGEQRVDDGNEKTKELSRKIDELNLELQSNKEIIKVLEDKLHAVSICANDNERNIKCVNISVQTIPGRTGTVASNTEKSILAAPETAPENILSKDIHTVMDDNMFFRINSDISITDFVNEFAKVLMKEDIVNTEELKTCTNIFYSLFNKYILLLETYSTLKSEFDEYKLLEEKERFAIVNKTVRYLDTLCSQLEVSGDSANLSSCSYASFNEGLPSSTILAEFNEAEITFNNMTLTDTKDPLAITRDSNFQTPLKTPLRSAKKPTHMQFKTSLNISKPIRTPLKISSESSKKRAIRTPAAIKYDKNPNESLIPQSKSVTKKERDINDLKDVYDKKVCSTEEIVEQTLESFTILEERITKLESLSVAFQKEKDYLTEDNKTLRDSLAKYIEEMSIIRDKLVVEVVSLNPDLKGTLSEISTSEIVNIFLNAIIESCKNMPKELSERLLTENKELIDKSEMYEAKLFEAAKELERLKEENAALMDDRDAGKKMISDLNNQIQSLLLDTSEVSNLRLRVKYLDEKLRDSEKTLQTEVYLRENAHKDVEKMKSYFEKVENENSHLKEQLDEFNKLNQVLSTELETEKIKIKSLEMVVENFEDFYKRRGYQEEDLREKVASLENEIRKKIEVIQKMCKEQEDAHCLKEVYEKIIASLKEEIIIFKHKDLEFEAIQNCLNMVKKEWDEKEMVIDELGRRLRDFVASEKLLNSEIESLRKKLVLADERIKANEGEIRKLQMDTNLANSTIAEYLKLEQDRLCDVEKELDKVREEFEYIKIKNEQLEALNSELSSKVQAYELLSEPNFEEIISLKKKVMACENALESSKINSEKLVIELKEMEENVNNKVIVITNLLSEVTNLKELHLELSSKCSVLEFEKSVLLQALRDSQKRKENLLNMFLDEEAKLSLPNDNMTMPHASDLFCDERYEKAESLIFRSCISSLKIKMDDVSYSNAVPDYAGDNNRKDLNSPEKFKAILYKSNELHKVLTDVLAYLGLTEECMSQDEIIRKMDEMIDASKKTLSEQINLLKMDIQDLASDNFNLRQEMNKLVENNILNTKKLTDLEEVKGTFETENQELLAKLDQRNAKLVELEKTEECLKAEMASLLQKENAIATKLIEYERAEEGMRADIAVLLERDNANKVEINALEEKNKANALRLAEYEKAEASLKEEIAALMKRDEENTLKLLELEKLEKHLKREMETLVERDNENKWRLAEYEKSEKTLKCEKASLVEVDNSNKMRLAEYEKAEALYKEEIEALITKYNTNNIKIEEYQKSEEALRTEIAELQEKEKETNVKLMEFEKLEEVLKAEVEALTAKDMSNNLKLEEYKNLEAALKAEIAELTAEGSSSKMKLMEFEKAEEGLKADIEALLARNSMCTLRLVEYEQTEENLKANIVALKEKENANAIKILELEESAKENKIEMDSLLEKNNANVWRLAEYEKAEENLKEEIAALMKRDEENTLKLLELEKLEEHLKREMETLVERDNENKWRLAEYEKSEEALRNEKASLVDVDNSNKMRLAEYEKAEALFKEEIEALTEKNNVISLKLEEHQQLEGTLRAEIEYLLEKESVCNMGVLELRKTEALLRAQLDALEEKVKVNELKLGECEVNKETLRNENASLLEAFNLCKARLTEYEGKVSTLKAEIETLREKDSWNLAKLEEYQISEEKLKLKIAELLEKEEANKVKLMESEKSNDVLRDTVESLKRELSKLESKCKLNRKKDLCNRKIDKLEELNHLLCDLIGKILVISGLEYNPKLNILTLRMFESESKKILDHLNGWIASKTNEIKELKSQIQELDEECESCAKMIKDSEMETVKVWEESRKEMNNLELKIMELEEENKSLLSEKEKLLEQVKKLQSEKKTTSSRLNNDIACGVENGNSEIKSVIDEKDELKKRNAALRLQVNELEKELAQSKKQVEELDEECETYTKAVKDARDETLKVWEESQKEMESLKTQIDRLKQEKKRMEADKSLAKQLMAHKNDLSNADLTNSSSQTDGIDEPRQCGGECKDVKQLKAAVSSREMKILELEQLNEKHVIHKSQIKYLENSLALIKKQFAEEKEKNARLQTEVQLLRNSQDSGQSAEDIRIRKKLKISDFQYSEAGPELHERERVQKLEKDIKVYKELCRTRNNEIKRLEMENLSLKGHDKKTKNSNQMDSPIRTRNQSGRQRQP